MSEHRMVSWFREQAKLTSFSTVGRGKVTTVTIKIDVTDPYALRSIIGDLQEIQVAQSEPKRGGGNG